MKRLRMLLAVVAATAVLVVAASPAMAGAFVGMGALTPTASASHGGPSRR
jgi:hypothetical protein